MTLTAQPLANSQELRDLRNALDINVPQPERISSMAAGAGLVILGASRRSLAGIAIALLGAALIRRGATGHCALYKRLGINSRRLNTEPGVPGNKGIKVVQTITVQRSPLEVYRYWRNLENLARFMDHVESVRELDERRSAWVVRGPMGQDVEWMAQIITEREGEMIAWESLPGAEVQNAGSVWFQPVGSDSTEVKVSIQYHPPAGALGAAVARIFGEAPEQQLQEDLGRFKKLIETGAAAETQANSQSPMR